MNCAHVIIVHELFPDPVPVEPEPGTVWAGEPTMKYEKTGRWICPLCGLTGDGPESAPQNGFKEIFELFHGGVDGKG